MAIVLYRKGNTHIVNGIECELKRVEPKRFSGLPDEGWFFSPEEAYSKEVEEETKENNALNYDSMNNKEIREHAEKADIDDWHTARIQPLKDKLKAL